MIASLHKRGIALGALSQHGPKGGGRMSAALVRSLPVNEKRIVDAPGIHPMAIWPRRKPLGFRALHDDVFESFIELLFRILNNIS